MLGKQNSYTYKEKCGEIYRIKSEFMYHCSFCCENYSDIIKFHIHIHQNHEYMGSYEIPAAGLVAEGKINTTSQYLDENQKERNEVRVKEEMSTLSLCDESIDSIEINMDIVDEFRVSDCNKSVKINNGDVENNSSDSNYKTVEKNEELKKNKKNAYKNRTDFGRLEWIKYKTFKSENEFQTFLEREKMWSANYKNYSKKGLKRYYRCNRVRKRDRKCEAALCLFENLQTSDYVLLKKNSEHTCVETYTRKRSSISTELKNEIKNLYRPEIKIKDIVSQIEKNFKGVNNRQVADYCKHLKQEDEKKLNSIVYDWIVGQNIDINIVETTTPLIVHHEKSGEKLRFFISTKNLLKNAINAEHINLNGIIKITWQNYSIFVVGTTSDVGKFLTFGVALCQSNEIEDFQFLFESIVVGVKKLFNIKFNPQLLYRDSNFNTEIAFTQAFGEDKHIKICWNHVECKIRKKLEYLLPDHHDKKESILADLNILQKSKNLDAFRTAIYSFENKWAIYVEFITYLHQEWFSKNYNWFEGIFSANISNNMALDCIVKGIENDEEFRSRIPFSQFKRKLYQWLENLDHLEYSNLVLNYNIYNKSETIMNHANPIFENTPERKCKKSSKGRKVVHKNLCSLQAEKKAREKKRNRQWIEECTFSSYFEATKAIDSEQTWGFSFKNKSKAGVKRYYRCKKVPTRGKSCDASIYLLLKSNCTDVVLGRSNLQHTCHKIVFKPRKLNDSIRNEIERLTELNFRPRQILEYFHKINFSPMPTRLQINNYVNVIREKKYGIVNLKNEELEIWFKNKSEIPNNLTKMFIVTYYFKNDNFRFFVSSKKLLQNGVNLKILNCDGIHKLEWIQFPIYIITTSNSNGKFNCLGIAVCSHNGVEDFEFLFKSVKDAILRTLNNEIFPEILITDTNLNIKSAFHNIFGSSCKIKTCYDLVRKDMQRKLEELNIKRDLKNKILKDIDLLHRSYNLHEFESNLIFFVNKYSPKEEFLNYFQKEWINSNNNWYQGYNENTFKINSNLDIEYFLKCIRNHELFRKKMSLTNFNTVLSDCIEMWSI